MPITARSIFHESELSNYISLSLNVLCVYSQRRDVIRSPHRVVVFFRARIFMPLCKRPVVVVVVVYVCTLKSRVVISAQRKEDFKVYSSHKCLGNFESLSVSHDTAVPICQMREKKEKWTNSFSDFSVLASRRRRRDFETL